MLEIEVHENKPLGFISKVDGTICYVEAEGKLLFLQQGLSKREPGAWEVPGGKIEAGETPQQGVRRELFEETGISLSGDYRLHSIGMLYLVRSDMSYILHLFYVKLDEIPPIALSDEHQSYTWVSVQETETMHLIKGGKEALSRFHAWASKKRRVGASVNAYLILRRGSEILFILRKNTGYFDGHYGLIAGHVEEGESASTGMAREAYEEAGIGLHPSQLKAIHVLHRKSDRLNVDIFFECSSYMGIVKNNEPEKCAAMKYFSLKNLPENTIGYIAEVLKAIEKGEAYSEIGWE